MANHARGEAIETEIISFERRQAVRIAIWASLALVALALAYLAARSETGTQRLSGLLESKPAGTARGASQLAERSFNAEIEARRLNEAVRLLTADRDRLLARISSLERNLDDVTGSVGNTAASPPAGDPAAGPGSSPLPPSLAPVGAPQPSPARLAPEPMARQAPEPTAERPTLEPIPPAKALQQSGTARPAEPGPAARAAPDAASPRAAPSPRTGAGQAPSRVPLPDRHPTRLRPARHRRPERAPVRPRAGSPAGTPPCSRGRAPPSRS